MTLCQRLTCQLRKRWGILNNRGCDSVNRVHVCFPICDFLLFFRYCPGFPHISIRSRRESWSCLRRIYSSVSWLICSSNDVTTRAWSSQQLSFWPRIAFPSCIERASLDHVLDKQCHGICKGQRIRNRCRDCVHDMRKRNCDTYPPSSAQPDSRHYWRKDIKGHSPQPGLNWLIGTKNHRI